MYWVDFLLPRPIQNRKNFSFQGLHSFNLIIQYQIIFVRSFFMIVTYLEPFRFVGNEQKYTNGNALGMSQSESDDTGLPSAISVAHRVPSC